MKIEIMNRLPITTIARGFRRRRTLAAVVQFIALRNLNVEATSKPIYRCIASQLRVMSTSSFPNTRKHWSNENAELLKSFDHQVVCRENFASQFVKDAENHVSHHVTSTGTVAREHDIGPDACSDGVGYDEGPKLICDQPDVVFGNRTSKQLLRALFSLQCCSYDILVKNSMKLMNVGQRFMGERLFKAFMKATIYGHFVAGDETYVIDDLAQSLAKVGVSGLVTEMLEEDVGERTGSIEEDAYQCNVQKICASFDRQLMVSQYLWYPPINAVKLTAIINANVLKKVSELWRDEDKLLENDSAVSVQNILDGLNGKLQPLPGLSSNENYHLQQAMNRLDRMAREAANKGVRLFIDAERNNVQPAINLLAVATMWKYNKNVPWVLNTYQSYFKDSLENMQKDVQFFEAKNICFGAKIVRGAYLEYEKMFITNHPGEDYLQPSYDATTEAYNILMDYGLSLVKTMGVKRCNVNVATQNEESTERAVKRMWELGIPAKSGAVLFSQQLGMADHLSVALGQAGYPVYKLFPCGSVEETVPYMTRRAQENHSVFHRISKEKHMLRQELTNRLLRRK